MNLLSPMRLGVAGDPLVSRLEGWICAEEFQSYKLNIALYTAPIPHVIYAVRTNLKIGTMKSLFCQVL